ncbi:MAG: HD domain-containing protein [Nitrosarchaeum sp.]|nr:HD domain-containing protein [Nitrosarchaeum sp.]MCA9820351.1 HD domain-containing protein [Nitrosarchaeum sp.]
MDVLHLLQKHVRRKMKNDPAHDFAHIMRVYNNAKKIAKKENANEKLVLSAVLLHDIVSYSKSDNRSKFSSSESAKEARKVLSNLGSYSSTEINIVCDAILDHSYSRGRTPTTLEGKILQDADRLDAIGAIGIARVFAVGGAEKRPFYNDDDPFCKKRSPNDKIWTIDHFYQKLLKLESLMNTKSAKIEAKKRTLMLKSFLAQLKKEI